ncbi:efflux RND transporter periplasmic adaptor subunit [Dinoroseobacter sp. S76]|uniref:efflux RND transporter periplasmic adaptor subunit n=1 Tax=Dinoroseobacter sp. S76 TaxID=3415124 RepID=UPI003C7C5C6E
MTYQASLATLLLLAALPAALPVGASQSDVAAPETQPQFVKTFTVPDARAGTTRQFFGQIAALETVDISFEVGGHLELLEAQEGQTVPAGTLLARLDLAPFTRAVERAELNLAQAERALTRARTLADRNAVSNVQAEDAETARDLADVALREARDALEDAQIHAPFEAIIADRIGTAFSNVEPGMPVLRLHNMAELRVEFDLPERLLADIGDPRSVQFEGQIAGLDTRLPLEFREFRAETKQLGQSYELSLAIPAQDHAILLPGRTVVVLARTDTHQDGAEVPASAISTRPDGTHLVVAIREEGGLLRAHHIPVTVTALSGAGFLVDGLEPGTEIVEVGAHRVANNAVVKRYTGLIQEGL